MTANVTTAEASETFLQRGERLVQEVDPYIPGLTRAAAAAVAGVAPNDVAKLSSNENPLGPPPLALEAIERQMRMVHEYPSPTADDLRKAIGELHGVEADQVVVGAGSSSLMHAIVETFSTPGGQVISMDPGFNVDPEIAVIHGREPVRLTLTPPAFLVDINRLESLITKKTQIIFLTRPNNPTSTLAPSAIFERAADLGQRVGALVVSDEAYIEFADMPDCSAIPLIRGASPQFPNVMVTRTFSKAYGIANLRLGYAIAAREAARCLALGNAKWPTGAVAQAAGVAAIKDKDHFKKTLQVVAEGRRRLIDGFNAIGLPVTPEPQGNYVMVDVRPSGFNAPHFTEQVLKLGAVVIRGDFSPHYVRVSVGRADENERVLAAAAKIVKGNAA